MSLFHPDGKRMLFFDVTSVRESGLIAGGRESNEGRQTVFFTPLSQFGDYPGEEEPSNGLLWPREVHYHSKWKAHQDVVCWIILTRQRITI